MAHGAWPPATPGRRYRFALLAMPRGFGPLGRLARARWYSACPSKRYRIRVLVLPHPARNTFPVNKTRPEVFSEPLMPGAPSDRARGPGRARGGLPECWRAKA